MPTELTLNPSEGLPITLNIEPFAFDMQLEPGYVYKLSSAETAFTIEHTATSLTICLDKEVKAELFRRPQSDEAADLAEEWVLFRQFV